MKYISCLILLFMISSIVHAERKAYLEIDTNSTQLNGQSTLDLYPLGYRNVPQGITETQLDITGKVVLPVTSAFDLFAHVTQTHKTIVTQSVLSNPGVLGTSTDEKGTSFGGGIRFYFN
jgi:hypothetical protein